MGVHLLSVEALDGQGEPVTLRWSSGEYTEDGLFWNPRMKQPGLYTEGLFAGEILPVSRSGYGETTLVNTDGSLNYLVEYAMDGREAVLSYYSEGVLTTILKGTVSRVGWRDTEISVKLRDPIEPLNNRHPSESYKGDNVLPDGLEGTEDSLAGNVKPRVYGAVKNASPPLVNTARLIYQVSDGECTVDAVYDNGVELVFDGDYTSLSELEGTPPTEGQWDDWEPPKGRWRRYKGYFRLGASPVGQITCDASTSSTLAGDVFESIASEAGASVSPASVSALNQQGSISVYVDEERDTSDILDSIIAGVGGWWRVTQVGDIEAGILQPPGSVSHTIKDYTILSISRESSGAGDNGIPIHSVEVSCDPIESTQEDLAGDVPEERRARLAKASRKIEKKDESVLDRHPLSTTLEIASPLSNRADGDAVASRVLSLVSVRRDSVEIVASTASSGTQEVSLGDTVKVVTDRLGYESGRDMLVVGRLFDQRKKKLTLKLWG